MIDVDSAYSRLRSAGLRLTPQRRAVIESLVGDTSHPTVEEMATRLATTIPGTSLSTVYKVLHELAQLGLVRYVDIPGAMRFDPATEDHVHVLCEECGKIVDTPLPTEASAAIVAAANAHGMTPGQIDIVVRASCTRCTSS